MTTSDEAIAIRRVVTGHDKNGRSVIAQDSISPFILTLPSVPGLVVTDLWKTFDSPANAHVLEEPCTRDITLTPPRRGTVLRTVQFPPDASYMDKWDPHAHFSSMGSESALENAQDKAAMHCTQTVDYAIVLSGEIWALMDEGEVLLRRGDVLVQRATNHGWSNRSEQPALVAFVLVDAQRYHGPSED
ncbi:cupin domain-containing protein [Pusillimonas caeni]|uniref:cupin domain-containing protein n=1 Tax=Pusillimonas caeni TaxID=1348472 RepID=UPI000E599789|nr:cupin domain-containing protein [Pusillimonas caeni]TFL11355.1 cupin domain-containing protein [Pusillimonas caeni]